MAVAAGFPEGLTQLSHGKNLHWNIEVCQILHRIFNWFIGSSGCQ